MSMTPTERQEAKVLLKNSIVSPNAKDLIMHALGCNDPNCVRCGNEWRIKPWVIEVRAKDLGTALPTATKPDSRNHRL